MTDDSISKQSIEKINIQELQDHEDIKRGFVHVLNAVEPPHSYLERSQIYPLQEYNIKYSYKRANSPYYASCGPRSDTRQPVFFAADRNALSQNTPERNLSIYIHELTHLNVGSHTDQQHGSHPPRFWREFGFNAHLALENWTQLETNLGASLSKESFVGYIVDVEVNSFNIDQRYHDVPTLQHQMARWFENTLQ